MTKAANLQQEMLGLLDEVLALNGRSRRFEARTPLLGSLPELDSMAVVSVIQAIESRFGLQLDEEDITGATFATVGSLVAFVEERLPG